MVPDAISIDSLIQAFAASEQCKQVLVLLIDSAVRELDFGLYSFVVLFRESEKRCFLHNEIGFLSNLGAVYGGDSISQEGPGGGCIRSEPRI